MSSVEQYWEWLSNSTSSPETRWKTLTQRHRQEGMSFSDCEELWGRVFQDWPSSFGPRPMWLSEQQQRKTNIESLAAEVGVTDAAALHRWSIENRSDFWEAVVHKLGICFTESANETLDISQGVPESRWFPDSRLNILDSCLPEVQRATDDSERPAIIWSQPDQSLTTWSRQELANRVNETSAALQNAGLAGQRMAIFMPMTAWSVVLYLAVIHTGGTVVSIADSFSAKEIRRRLDIVDCRWVITTDFMLRAGKKLPLLERVHQASRLGNPIRSVVLACRDTSEPGNRPEGMQDGDLALSELLAKAQETRLPPVSCSEEHPMNILFSSGTTGDPKAIPWTHLTPIKCAMDGWLHHDLHPGDVVAWPTNLGWMMGPWLIFATLINRCGMALYHDAPVGIEFGRFVENARVTMLGLVPSMVKSWRATGDLESCDWSSIRCFSSTGESSNASDYFYLSWLAGFKPVIEYCGGTEIGGGYISSTLLQNNAPATFSSAAFGLDFVILDEAGRPADEGELFLVPPSIGLSQSLLNRDHYQTYYSDTPAYGDSVLRRHGDHFRRLPGGYYEAGGRTDDTMNLGGIKVSSIELERTLNELPGVRESAAVAVDSPDQGPSQLGVFLVLQDTGTVDEGEWLQRCNVKLKTDLNPLFRASWIKVVDHLPRTASNKVMRRLLRENET